MTKRIVLLSDGTGNAAASPHKSNIWRLYKAIKKSASSEQVAFYDDGVGTSSFIVTRLLGQVFGWGLKSNVKDLYRNLCRVYKSADPQIKGDQDDKIFIYGYSRGAFTARMLAALIANQGIITAYDSELDLEKKIEEAYDDFRHQTFVPSILTLPIWIYRWFKKDKAPQNQNSTVRKIYTPEKGPLIEFLGVWDTVDAYGAPIDEMTRGWDMIVWPLTAKDRDLSPAVHAAYQALALDERRESFEPMLWNEDGHSTQQLAGTSSQTIEQVWFSGVHANVGGGYPDDAVAHVSLNWMIKKSEMHGLSIDDALKKQYEAVADTNGPIYDNRAGFGNAYRFAPRKVETLCNSKKPGLVNTFLSLIGSKRAIANEVRIDCPKIHHTVFDRIKNGGDGYAPINLPEKYSIVNKDGEIVAQPEVSKAGQPLETSGQASMRRVIQSDAWNKVWFLRVLYILMLAAVLWFVAAPYLLDAETNKAFNDSGDVVFGQLGEIFRLIPVYIGEATGLDFIANWTNRYSELPYTFLVGLGLIISLVLAAAIVKSRLKSTMRQHWSHIHGKGNSWLTFRPERSVLAEFLDSYRVPGIEENRIKTSLADHGSALFRLSLELLSALFFLIVLIWAIWKICFIIQDGTGFVCVPDKDLENADRTGKEIEFDPTVPCLDTGVNFIEGTNYTLEFKVPKSWSDATIKADAHGLLEEPTWGMTLFTPFRRHVAKGWFQPVGRIGHTQFDRYTAKAPELKLKPRKDGLTREPDYCIKFEFSARQNGRLYIYLNDAVAPWPFKQWYFYENNCKGNVPCEMNAVLKITKSDTKHNEEALCSK